MLDPIDEKLARVNARLAEERAAGRQRPTSDWRPSVDPELKRREQERQHERKQAIWDYLLEFEPELAQLIRSLKARGIAFELHASDWSKPAQPGQPPWRLLSISSPELKLTLDLALARGKAAKVT